MFGIREQALELLKDGNFSATALADRLRVNRNTVSHAVIRSYKAGEVRIVDHIRTGKDLAPVYGLGGGDDVERPGPLDPNNRSAAYRARNPGANRASSRAWRERNLEHVLAKQAEYRARRRAEATADEMPVAPVESCLHTPVLIAKEPAVTESRLQNPVLIARKPAVTESSLEYHEIPEMPGVKRFTCVKLRSTLSIESCADRWENANGPAPDPRMSACKGCAIGGSHAGKTDLNTSPWKGSLRCARCGEGAMRLIGGHLCLSDYNRQREKIRGFNAKHTEPKMHPPLHRRSVSYRADGEVRTKSIEHTIGLEEVLFSVLRTEIKSVKFGFRATALRTLFGGDEWDRSIDAPDDISVTPELVTENLAVAPAHVSDDVIVELDAERVTAEFDVLPADPYAEIREAVELLDHDATVNAPGVSRRASKKARQKARQQVRVSNVTVNLLRGIGALPRPVPVVAPIAVPFYSASLYSGGSAIG